MNPQHQLTGSEELEDIIAKTIGATLKHGEWSPGHLDKILRNVLVWHTKHLAKARLEGQIESLKKFSQDFVIKHGIVPARSVSVKKLADLILELEAQLASMEKTE
jgi:hypothetical protein